MTTFSVSTVLLMLALVLGLVGTVLGVIALRLCFELLFHLPDVLEQIQEERDGNLRLRSYVLLRVHRILQP